MVWTPRTFVRTSYLEITDARFVLPSLPSGLPLPVFGDMGGFDLRYGTRHRSTLMWLGATNWHDVRKATREGLEQIRRPLSSGSRQGHVSCSSRPAGPKQDPSKDRFTKLSLRWHRQKDTAKWDSYRVRRTPSYTPHVPTGVLGLKRCNGHLNGGGNDLAFCFVQCGKALQFTNWASRWWVSS